MLVELYDIFTSEYNTPHDSVAAWEFIELGIAERHILYIGEESLLELTEKSTLYKTIQLTVELFHRQGKYWIIQYSPPPTLIGNRFSSTILVSHFGYLIRHSKKVDIKKYSSSPLFKKPRGIRKNFVAENEVMKLYAEAIGIYADNPEEMMDTTDGSELTKFLIRDYQNFNIY